MMSGPLRCLLSDVLGYQQLEGQGVRAPLGAQGHRGQGAGLLLEQLEKQVRMGTCGARARAVARLPLGPRGEEEEQQGTR